MSEKPRITADPLTYTRQGDSTVFKPQAQALDTFVRPAEPVASSWHDVAKSLAEVRPGLNRFIEAKGNEIAVEDIKAAERAAMTTDAVSLQEAIDSGKIQPGQSALFQRTFDETVGKRVGITKAPMTVYQAWVSPDNADRNSTDPAVIDAFFDKQTAKMLEGKSEHFKDGFIPQMLAVRQQLSSKITAENAAEVEEKLSAELGQLMFDRLKNAGGQSPAQLAAAIAEDTIPARFVGLKGTKANGIIAQAIVSAAQTSGNAGLLKVGYEPRPDLKNPGMMIPGVFTTPKYAIMADNAQTTILSKQNAQAARAAHVEAKAEKDAVKAFFPELLKYRRDNPDDPNVPAELLDKAAKLSIPPTAVVANWNATGKLAPPMDYTTKIGKLAALAEISNRNGDVAAYLARNPGLVTDEKAFSMLAAGDVKHVFSNDMYNVQARAIDGMTDIYTKKFDPATGASIIREAKSELSGRALDLYLSLAKDGKGVDPKKLSDGLNALGTEITMRMRALSDAKDEPPPKPTPGKPGATSKPAGATSAPSAIPSDRIVGVSDATRGYQFPSAMTTTTGGSSIISTWAAPDGVVIDIREINLLRQNPFALGSGGASAWKRFDEIYGTGASRYFITNDAREINTFFDNQRLKRQQAFEEVQTRVRNSKAPTTVP